jgi:oligopeptide/dipeptide ABC transporter ATP-binding protein
MREAILQINNLQTYYDTQHGVVKAVDDVSFEVFKEDFFGLVGESGCGKSTLGHSIPRLIRQPGRIVNGEIIFKNQNLLKKTETEMRDLRGSEISMIFQDPTNSLNPVFNIGGQIEESIILHRHLRKPEAKKEVIEVLRSVGIPDPERIVNQYPHEYSGGMKQRVMIAIALCCQPSLLIADEPTTNLDVTIQAQILDLLKLIRKIHETTMILITHNLGVVAETCERVGVMYAGKIVELGDTINIFKNPKHPYTIALLSAVPRIDIESEKLASIPGSVPDLISPPKGCNFCPRCKYSTTKCMNNTPKLENITEDHFVACYNYEAL